MKIIMEYLKAINCFKLKISCVVSIVSICR